MARERLSPVRRRLLCLASSLAAFVLALALLGYSAYWFVPRVFFVITRPIVEFDEGESVVVTPEDDARVYILSLVVDSIDTPLPTIEVEAQGIDGATVASTEATGWASIFGRKFQRLRRLDVEPGGGAFEIVADVTDEEAVEGRADFVLFGDSELAGSRYIEWATPWWIAGATALAVSMLALGLAVFWRGETGLLGSSLND